MKLTKGKIRKLYNKKKQTLKKKKINKKKSPNRNNTFRSKREINLSRQSLKRLRNKKYKGGVIEPSKEVDKKQNEDPKVENDKQPSTTEDNAENIKKLDETSLDELPSQNKGFENEKIQETPSGFTGVISSPPPSEELESIPAPEQSESVFPPEPQEVEYEHISQDDANAETLPEVAPDSEEAETSANAAPARDPEVAPDSEETETSANAAPARDPEVAPDSEETETSANAAPARDPEVAPDSEETETSANAAPAREPESPVESLSEENEISDSAVPDTEPESPIQQVPSAEELETVPSSSSDDNVNSESKLTESINNVVDILSDKIAEKLALNIGDKSGEGLQNGFISVGNSAETMASKGGQFKKTRRFRLIRNKNSNTRGQK